MKCIVNNESGVVLVTVLAISIVLMVFVLGILSTNINQVVLGQKVIDRIKAEEMAKGEYWRNFTIMASGEHQATVPTSTFTDEKNRTFQSTLTPAVDPHGGPNQTQQFDLSVNY